MKNLLLALLLSGSAFAAGPNCVVADSGNRNRVSVPVTVVSGAQVVEKKVTQYNGSDISVQYQTGDRFEPQTILTLTGDGYTAQTYNVSKKGLYQLMGKNFFLQCYFE